MKVFFDYQAFNQTVGGVSRYHVELLKRLPDYGIEVDFPKIFTRNTYLKQAGYNIRQPIGFGKYSNQLNSWLNQQICRHALRKTDADIFHPTFVNPYYADLSMPKTVITVHDLIHEKLLRNDSALIRHRRMRQLINIRGIICVSNQTKGDLLLFYPFLKEMDIPIQVIYHGHTTDSSHPGHSKPLFDKPYVLYVGSRDSYKNFSFFLRAFTSVKSDVNLVCTGAPFSTSETMMINQLGLSSRIQQFFASDRELRNLYTNARAFIYPSLMEGFGIPILEAFGYECPVIASDIQCFHEVGGGAPCYFNPHDINELACTIERVIHDDTLRSTMIAAGKKRLENFSWDKMAAQTAEFYKLIH